jgi:hypothetical protein
MTDHICLCTHSLELHDLERGQCQRAGCGCICYLDKDAVKPEETNNVALAQALRIAAQMIEEGRRRRGRHEPARHTSLSALETQQHGQTVGRIWRLGVGSCVCGHTKAYHLPYGPCNMPECYCGGFRDKNQQSPPPADDQEAVEN